MAKITSEIFISWVILALIIAFFIMISGVVG